MDDVLGPGLDDFLSWTREQGEPVPAGGAGVALVLLVLRGAGLRGGLPLPTAKHLSQVLGEDLPHLVCRDPEEVAAYPRVLELLVDHQRAAGLLNAERHRALRTAVRKSVPDYERAVADPLGLSWPRLYGGLLRAGGVDVADPQAVRAWLEDYLRQPRSWRRAALVSALGAPDGPAEGWVETAVILRQRVEMVALRTSVAELHLSGQIHRWVIDGLDAARRGLEAAGRGRPPAGGQSPDGGARVGVDAVGDVDTAADFLVDRATAAGLSAVLRGEFSELAPRADSAAGDDLVARLRRSRGTWRLPDWSLPPVQDIPAEQFAGLVGTSALLAAAVELAEWVAQRGGLRCPQGAMPAGEDVESAAARLGLPAEAVQEVWRVALATGLLRVAGGPDDSDGLDGSDDSDGLDGSDDSDGLDGPDSPDGRVAGGQDGRVVAGSAVQVWRGGSAPELLELALDALAAVAAELGRLASRAADAGVADQDCETLATLARDLPDTLLRLCTFPDPESLARLVAVQEGWALPKRVDDIHPEDRAVPAMALAARLRPPRPRRTHPSQAAVAAGTDPGSGAVEPVDSVDSAEPVEYRLPPEPELQRLLGFDDIDDEERADLLDQAYWQALLLDRLDALGVLRRDADRVELSTLGKTLLRAVLLLAGFEAPTAGSLAAADADTLLRRMPSWSRPVQLDALTTWLQARQHTDTAWKEMVQAAAAGPRHHRGVIFELLGVWSYLDPTRYPTERPRLPVPLAGPDAEQQLLAALREAVPDPVIGAYAAEALRLRGVPSAEPGRPARAVLLLDRLQLLCYAESRPVHEDGEGDDASAGRRRERPGTALCAAFDAAAADWPGGPGDLLRELAAVSEPADADTFDLIGHAHPDIVVAAAARAARHRIGRGPHPATPGRSTSPQPPASSGHRQQPDSRPARKRKRHR
jgi:hypothetical protein